MAEKKNADDAEMLKWFDVLVELDPVEDIEAVELAQENGELDMHEAAAAGDLDDEGE